MGPSSLKLSLIEKSQRPREKAFANGISTLSDQELLSLILSSGTPSFGVTEVSGSLLEDYGGLKGLSSVPYLLLEKEKGIGRAKSSLLGAVFEVARRVSVTKRDDFEICLERDLLSKEEESFYVYFLNQKGEVLGKRLLLLGSLSCLRGDKRNVYSSLLYSPEGEIVLVHAHPSGVPLPSKEDIEFTFNCSQFLSSFSKGLKDHLIITKQGRYSFSENGLL